MKTTNQNAEVGVIVARFQTPFLHEGHVDILNQVLANHPRVLVFLGTSPVRCSKNNPLDFQARKAMIEQKYPQVEVGYIEDVGDNEVWSKKLDEQIRKTIGPSHKPILYGSRDSFIAAYSGKYPTIELIPNKIISASEIRKACGIKAKTTQEFREGVIWAVENQFPVVVTTVDMAVVNFTKMEVLMAKKPHETTLRFPGGHAETKTQSFEADALLELKQETGLEFTKDPIYIGSTLINSWRYRSEASKIKTLMFVAEYEGGTPVADDDIAFVQWVKFDELSLEKTTKEHRPLLEMLVKYLNKTLLEKKGMFIKL